MNRSRLVNALGVAIGVAGIAFVVRRVIQDRHDIADAFSTANLGWLTVGFIGGLVSMTLIGLNWLLIIRHAGSPAPLRRGLAWFFVGQLGKYVPGGIWPIVGQAELARRASTPRSVAYSSTAMSMVATFLGAASVGAVAGLIDPPNSRVIPLLLVAGLVVVMAMLGATASRSVVHGLVDRVTSRGLRLPERGWFLTVVARHLPVWLAFSMMNVCTVLALGIHPDARLVVELVYVTCISWMAGFVIVGVPGGIGVRETIFISMMSAPLGSSVAVSVAVLSRLVSVVVDLVGAGVAVPIARTAPPVQAIAAETSPASPTDPDTTDRYAAP